MGRPKTIDDDAILAAARQVFQARGHAATTRDVALAAGISQAILYQRFATKDALFFAAMMPLAPDLDALLGDPATGGANERQFEEIAVRLLRYFAKIAPAILHVVTHPAFETAMIEKAHAQVAGKGLINAVSARVTALKSRGDVDQEVDALAVAETIVGAVHSVAMSVVLRGGSLGRKDEIRVRRISAAVCLGMNPRVRPSGKRR